MTTRPHGRERRLMSDKELENAIDKLASLFEDGELIASTDPSMFLTMVCEEIVKLRNKIQENALLRDTMHKLDSMRRQKSI